MKTEVLVSTVRAELPCKDVGNGGLARSIARPVEAFRIPEPFDGLRVSGSLSFDERAADVQQRVAGVDEAGRGPLAGPVVAAAVILDPARRIDGIGDSKALTERQRDALALQIRERALAWSVAWADAAEIDTLNILQATFLAMRRALTGLQLAPTHIQVDGNRPPSITGLGFTCSIETIVKGDAKVACIGAASILAKTTRDAMLVKLDDLYPGYGLAKHKGYPTPAHYAALEKLGPSAIHRMSFAPVRNAARRDAQESDPRHASRVSRLE